MLAQSATVAAPRLRKLYREFEPDASGAPGAPGAPGAGAGAGAGPGTGAAAGAGAGEGSKEEGLQLIPIDHGFCLPECPTLACFEWRGWPQAEQA
jgi:hypothetical protein